MKIVDNIKSLYQNEVVSFILSIIGSFFMGTIHLIATISEFSWLSINYCLFCYALVAIIAVLTRLNQGEEKRRLYIVGAMCLMILMIPMTTAMVKTILERETPVYYFDWLIYVYATYGTVKIVWAIRSLHKARKSKTVYPIVTSWVSLIDAAFTIQMMEFALISTFDTEKSQSMIIMQFLTHGAIIIFTLITIIHLFFEFKKHPLETLDH